MTKQDEKGYTSPLFNEKEWIKVFHDNFSLFNYIRSRFPPSLAFKDIVMHMPTIAYPSLLSAPFAQDAINIALIMALPEGFVGIIVSTSTYQTPSTPRIRAPSFSTTPSILSFSPNFSRVSSLTRVWLSEEGRWDALKLRFQSHLKDLHILGLIRDGGDDKDGRGEEWPPTELGSQVGHVRVDKGTVFEEDFERLTMTFKNWRHEDG
ncbi:uncharacterized protein BT62DRAFT_1012023 [Guyanagaster necrorhizus]|uniref:Uncharacterized protein n=1 Tax=Guyanagaster necrorhizus TaxID=856835 RepID=A0A9P7VJ66_9AGAR|nr:uncharacterized protein BT62DRAFT_1012023 [Guyanagaster necrorhizus MCA 3950]KAG7440996.1 hypothetical protein BT62DRAFT_1012023 [Guyanagaster necrorhizus MCA 3950]